MPYLVSTSFDKFIENITVGGDPKKTATARRDSIMDLLKEKLEILDAFPTGSLVRNTALKNSSDVDVVIVLHYGKHIENKTPKQLLESVQSALGDYNAKIVKKNGQAVTLYFKTWPNVDIVPAKRVTSGQNYILKIPDANTGRWITIDPKSHDVKIANLPLRGRRLVRMIKCWNKSHSSYLLSYHIERILLSANPTHDGDKWTEDDWPWALSRYFEQAVKMTEPSTVISTEYGLEDWKQLRDRLKRAHEISHEAWSAIYTDKNAEKSIGRLRVLFGDKFPAYG